MSNISRQATLAPWCLFLLQRAVGIVIRARLKPTGSEVHLRVCGDITAKTLLPFTGY